MNLLSLALLTLALSGCADAGDTGRKPKDSDESPADADGDGHVDVAAGGDDCDDADGTVYSGASDATVDGTDQDCDGFDGPDADADGYAAAEAGGRIVTTRTPRSPQAPPSPATAWTTTATRGSTRTIRT